MSWLELALTSFGVGLFGGIGGCIPLVLFVLLTEWVSERRRRVRGG